MKFKQVKVIPLYKSGDPTDRSNYRPISILSLLSKPLEKNTQKHISCYLNNNDLIHENQSGFRDDHSCPSALIQLVVEFFFINVNNNGFTGFLFVDFTKAFDVINHCFLLKKASAFYEIQTESLELISSFLCDRQQLVEINSSRSEFLPVKYAVPQGSLLGSILFSLYINNLPLNAKCLCEMFADDTFLQSNNTATVEVVDTLQVSINRLISGTKLNHMALNR